MVVIETVLVLAYAIGTIAKLTNEEAEIIRNSNKSQSNLAREFNVTQPTISRIKNGHSY